jgi:pimeloyl-[acyl-carrier protein] methyl ester esterase
MPSTGKADVLHVEVCGSGPDLVLLHGWGMNAAIWDELAAQLAARFTVHSVDLPGHGYSAASVPDTAEATVSLLHAALPAHAVICGWSLGGQLALAWALRHPAQVARLVLIATTPRFVQTADWTSGMDVQAYDEFAGELVVDAPQTLRRFCALQARGECDERTTLRQLRACLQARSEPDVVALSAALRLLRDTDLRHHLHDIAAPVLLLHGARDQIAPLAAGSYSQRALPCAVLKIVDDGAHAPFLTRPRQFARYINEFCL